MTAAGFRKLALSLPDTVEGSHWGAADFRVKGKIFATLAYEKSGQGVLTSLTPDQRAQLIQDAPEIFSPVLKGCGKDCATLVNLAKVSPEVLEGVLRMAWAQRRQAIRKKKRPME